MSTLHSRASSELVGMHIELEYMAEGGPSESELDTVKLTVERFLVDSDEVLL